MTAAKKRKRPALKPLTISARSKVGRAVMELREANCGEDGERWDRAKLDLAIEILRLARRAGWEKRR